MFLHVCFFEHGSLQLVLLYLPDVFHAAHRLEGNTGSSSLQESLVNRRRVVEHGGADHSESHCSNYILIYTWLDHWNTLIMKLAVSIYLR